MPTMRHDHDHDHDCDELAAARVPVENRAGLAPAEFAAIADAVRGHRSLEAVVRWGLAHAPPVLVADVIVQDEYTHDVIVPYRAVWLAYDTT